MNQTSDARITETEWFRQPNSLLEAKIFSSNQDGLMYYIYAHRGINCVLDPSDKVTGVMVQGEVLKDNSAEQFQKLVKFLSTPVR